jgi:hypothetical protein
MLRVVWTVAICRAIRKRMGIIVAQLEVSVPGDKMRRGFPGFADSFPPRLLNVQAIPPVLRYRRQVQ